MSDPGLSDALDSLADSLRQLSLAIRPPPSSPRGSSEGWVLVSPEPPVEPGSRAAPGPFAVHHSRLTSSELTARYNTLESGFPPLPSHCLHSCRSLTGSGSSPEARASRAWKAGQWARLVLEDVVPTPRPTARIPSTLRPRIYIVLRCEGLQCPVRFSSGKLFKDSVGSLPGTDTVCQAFPSLAEAEVFCEAAGCALPPEQ